MKLRSNIHPCDRLADVRDRIRELEAEEGGLRAWLLSHPGDRTGDEWHCEVTPFTRRSIDLPAATMRLGADLLAPFVTEKTWPVVRVVARKDVEP
jgi:hypothetical protein